MLETGGIRGLDELAPVVVTDRIFRPYSKFDYSQIADYFGLNTELNHLASLWQMQHRIILVAGSADCPNHGSDGAHQSCSFNASFVDHH